MNSDAGMKAGKPRTSMIHAKNSDIAALIVKSVEGKPMRGELQVKPMIESDEMTLLEVRLPAGTAAPLHVHSHDSLIYVVTGKIKTTVGKDVFVLGPGDVCRHPRNVPHSVEALQDSLLIEVKAPSPDIGHVFGT